MAAAKKEVTQEETAPARKFVVKANMIGIINYVEGRGYMRGEVLSETEISNEREIARFLREKSIEELVSES